MFNRALSFLFLASAFNNTDAFVYTASSSRSWGLNAINPKSAFSFAKKAAKVRSMADLIGKDKDGNVVRVPVKNIEREWSDGDFKADGEFSADLFLPEEKEIKGCAFFMHGFSQYPVAYRQTLSEACEVAGVAIIAVETGVTDKFVRKDAEGKSGLQFNLQRAILEDTKQCIKMVLDGDEAFAEYNVTKKTVGKNIAVMGHSMGGGLCFPLAADCKCIEYVFTMAPAFGEPQFDPIIEGVKKRTPKHSMLLAGGWDLIARAAKVESISAAANSHKKNSSVYVKIARGLHTGFEDKIVLFSIPISSILKAIELIGILGLFDFAFVKSVEKLAGVLEFLRTKTGQIDGSGALMNYFLCAMVAGSTITPEAAEKYLDDNIADKFEKKFEFKYGEEKN